METNVSRRSFLKGGAILAATATAGAALSACSDNVPEAKATWMPETWDFEADIIVVGLGGAGLSASITARQAGLDVIALEAAPEEYCGGNTRVSGNYVLIPDNPDDGALYQTTLNGPYDVDPKLIKAWAEAVSENKGWLNDLDITLEETQFANPEFPGLPGSESIKTYAVDGKAGSASLWIPLYETAQDMDVNIQYNARATKLVYDPETREVCGLIASDKAYKARRGVILACGGFENNTEMLQDYYPTEGAAKVYHEGTPYNRGDGIKMLYDIGADMWHMNAFAGSSTPRTCINPEDTEFNHCVGTKFTNKDYIYVGPESKRYMYEESTKLSRHGRVKEKGAWPMQIFPNPTYIVMGSKTFDGDFILSAPTTNGWVGSMGLLDMTKNQDLLDKGIAQKGDTPEELAEKIGLDPAVFAETIATYNASCATGKDEEFGRGEALISNFAFDFSGSKDSNTTVGEGTVAVEPFELEALEAPYYAFEVRPCILNSQGGPKRNESNQVLNVEGEPIPRLYATGELGTIYAYMYNGGGNVSEAVASGRVAARHCASLDPWE